MQLLLRLTEKLIEGEFTSSAFVNEQIGVDNVCERSACAVSGGGEKLAGKTADNGITVAIYKMEQKLEMS